MPLSKPALTELAIESGALDLWNEWLAGFFNGASHAVGANDPVAFPQALLRYQQHDLPNNLDGVAISVVWVRPSIIRYAWDTITVNAVMQRQQMAYARTAFMFWIRAQLVESGAGNAEKQCRDAAQLLFAILANTSATRTLAEKGIHRLRPETPQLVSNGSGSKPGDPQYAMRLINATATLHYPVLSQT